ncbi:hydroxymethylbilane synthase [Dethiosulfatarculus sandiegensis]|uniref:Porphobilinogen deaminase n=1 Tax=Dethiosulfatarculus sandiegensis TaxID=1429043 RepID=A0A0D2JPL8_9BACT|nr:hydroxymethylbilane synthase [Dethiosulfatarculus sandiegensis]KIX11425.1 porphyrin biosynthesis protein HemD [Dethiosulfatarculus sandiegensis]
MHRQVVIATRGSKLALAQAELVARELTQANPGLLVDLKIIKTKGDKILDVPLAKVGGKGLFVKEIEEALIDGRADLAVHSMKDMPAELPQGLILGAVTERENPADVLVLARSGSLNSLPQGARVGTSSLRRAAQLLAVRPDFSIVSIRGNVQTRLKKLTELNLDAVVLASAGLRRLGLGRDMNLEELGPDELLPAVGQGALGIEIRENDELVRELVSKLNHPETAYAVQAERAFLARLEGGCQVPIAGYAQIKANQLHLKGLVASLDGTRVIIARAAGPREKAADLGEKVGLEVLDQGGAEILREVYAPSGEEMGKVYLVGAGPGDPELLTRKGARCLAEAQVVVYDFLANPELLALAPLDAEKIYVGKKGGDHTMSQENINELLVNLALKGLVVTRLKGGDPYVFGRGGEEASALYHKNVPFEVVPGITSAISAPSYAGIPVTDRRCSTEVAFVTGHEDPSKPDSTINWSALAGMGTLVFLMGVKNLPMICDRLMENGKPANTPCAIVRWGTTPKQVTLTGTLADLPEKVQKAGLRPPAVTIVGDVAGLRDELLWYEKLPLFGRRIMVTRARGQASKLTKALGKLGAEILETPTIAIKPPSDPRPLRHAVLQLHKYDWLVFTSPNGVTAFAHALAASGKDARDLAGLKLATIGPATGKALSVIGVKPDLVAKTFVAEGLLESMSEYDLQDARVLLPRALKARELLPETLRSQGAHVDVVCAYETVAPEGVREEVIQALDQGLDAVTFTASSTVSNLMKLLSDQEKERFASLTREDKLKVAAIGPITAGTAEEYGLKVHFMPQAYTIDDLVKAVKDGFSEK